MLDRRTSPEAVASTAAASQTSHAAVPREEWHDPSRARAIPVLIRLPDALGPAPVVVVSHGFGGSREGLAYLGEAFAAAGYAAVHVQHRGSDSSLWQGANDARGSFQTAAFDPRVALDRLYDVAFVLDELERRGAPGSGPLAGRLDLGRAAIAGHSFGAWTVMHMLGQRLPIPGFGPRLPDGRLRAGVALSPIPPFGIGPEAAFAPVRAPVLHVTGTADVGWGVLDWRERTVGFRFSSGPAVLAVLQGATHVAFAGEAAAGAYWNDPAYHGRTARLATGFLDGVLRGDAAAMSSLLHGEGLASADRVEAKGWA